MRLLIASMLQALALCACSTSLPPDEAGTAPDGGTCCKSTLYPVGDWFPTAFGVDDANVYWSAGWTMLGSSITAVAKDGGVSSTWPGPGCDVTGSIVADNDYLYAPCVSSSAWGLGQFPKDGGAMTDPAQGHTVSETFVDANDNLYWAGNGGIWKRAPGQAAVQVVADDVITFAVDNAGSYWWGLAREIRSTTTATIAAAEVPLGGLAADGTALYWLDTNAQTINVAPHGGTPSVLLNGLSQPSAIAVDNGFVYAVGVFEQHSSVVRVPKNGGAPEVLYAGGSVAWLGLDDAAIYTTDTRLGADLATTTMSVVRVLKPAP